MARLTSPASTAAPPTYRQQVRLHALRVHAVFTSGSLVVALGRDDRLTCSCHMVVLEQNTSGKRAMRRSKANRTSWRRRTTAKRSSGKARTMYVVRCFVEALCTLGYYCRGGLSLSLCALCSCCIAIAPRHCIT